jgi:hypothetical protein
MNSMMGRKAVHGRTHPDGGEAQLGDRRIDHPLLPEFGQHALAHFVSTVVLSHLLAHEEDVGVSTHFFAHRLVEGFAELDCTHG